MNDKQREWTVRHCNELKAYLDQMQVLTDEISEAVVGYINVIVSLSKGNDEVRNALFDLIEPYQRKAEETAFTKCNQRDNDELEKMLLNTRPGG